MTLADCSAALALAVILTTAGTSTLASTLRDFRLTAAARTVALELQRARAEALASGSAVGILFHRDPDGWSRHRDGGTPGIRRAEIDSGVDVPLGPVISMASVHEGIRFGFESPELPRIPPATGRIEGDDPIALGSSDIFSASPSGTSSSGTIYLTDGRQTRAVMVYGPTGRIRIWSHAPFTDEWNESLAGASR